MCVWLHLCFCICVNLWVRHTFLFAQGRYGDKAAGDMLCLYLCVCVGLCACLCVVARNDYYGLTPISRIESLHPWFFHSPGNGKENIFPSVAYYWDPVFCSHTLTHTKKTYSLTHPHPHTKTHPCTHWQQMTNQYLDLHGVLSHAEWDLFTRTTSFNKDHKHTYCLLSVTMETNRWSAHTVKHNDRRLRAPLRDIWMSWVTKKCVGVPQGVGPHGVLIITETVDLSEEGCLTKRISVTLITAYWTDHKMP